MKKDQFVALCADSQRDAELLLPYVKHLAEHLKKGILLFTCSADGKDWVEKLGVPFAALKSEWPEVVEVMPTAFNVVLAVTLANPDAPRDSSTNPRQILKNFKQSKIAYLEVPIPALYSPLPTPHSRVALTLNHQRESKEKLLWASYFARFFQSEIVVYHHPYSDPAFRQRLNNNIQYLEKTFSSLNIGYKLLSLPEGNQFSEPDFKAILQPGIDLFISLVADDRERDLVDFFTPSTALKLMKKAQSIPVLFLNQRDDLYIMCD